METTMKSLRLVLIAVPLITSAAQTLHAGELQTHTLSAWNGYLAHIDLQMQRRASGQLPFLWIRESPNRAARVRSGEIVVTPATGHGTVGVPDGLVHHWIAGIFIPGATITRLMAVIHDYDNYQRMYQPVVASSRTLACSGDRQEFQIVMQRKVLFVSAAMTGHYQSYDVTLDANRGYNVSEAMEVREIQAYGQSDERLLPPDRGDGFLWRIRSIARYEKRDGGVYLELEVVALTRDIPASLAWVVKPVVNHLTINSLTTTLRQTRDAVISPPHHLETMASCSNRVGGSQAPRIPSRSMRARPKRGGVGGASREQGGTHHSQGSGTGDHAVEPMRTGVGLRDDQIA